MTTNSHQRMLIITSLLLLLTPLSVHGASQPEEFQKNPDKYYADPGHVGQCESCDVSYFNNPSNIDKNTESHKRFFGTPGNVKAAPQGAARWLSKLGSKATFNLQNGNSDISLDTATGFLTNGKMTLNPRQYPAGTTIEALSDGGFKIAGTTIQGFRSLTYDSAKGFYEMDGSRVYLPKAPKEGQAVIGVRGSTGAIQEIQLPAKARLDLPQGNRRVIADTAMSVIFDGSDPKSRKEPAISFTDNAVEVNNQVQGWVQNGDLLVYASKGRYFQKEFPGTIDGVITFQRKDGSIITLKSAGDAEGFASSIREKPIQYTEGEPTDSRRDMVLRIQKLLNMNGASLSEDGGYGDKTSKAVAAFQEAHSLEPSGILDEETLNELNNNAGLSLVDAQYRKAAAIRRMAESGQGSLRAAIRRTSPTEPSFLTRLDTPPTVLRRPLVSHYEQLAEGASGKRKQLLLTIPDAIYQAAAEAEEKYGFPIDPAKLLALAAHETGGNRGYRDPFSSYNALHRNNYGGIKSRHGGYKTYDTPLDGARALVEHMYTSSHYFKKGKFSIDAISHTWCPLDDAGCDVHLDTWKRAYNSYRALR